MPVINNSTVATGTGLSTAGGGRKLVRLANNNLIAIFTNTNTNVVSINKSTDNGSSWSSIATLPMNASTIFTSDVAIAVAGNFIHITAKRFEGNDWAIVHYRYDQNGILQGLANTLDIVGTFGQVTSSVNEIGTEIHVAWSHRGNPYPSSFNIRYAKGTINGDGSVTWSAVEQVSVFNQSGYDLNRLTIVPDKNGLPLILSSYDTPSNNMILAFGKGIPTGGNRVSANWSNRSVFEGGSYVQSSPSAIFVPNAINGLANGRLWVAWHGKDATDSAKFNVRVSYSDDGGSTWATPVKLTTGNLYDRQNVSLAADKTGKVFALYEEHQWSPDLDIYMRTYNGSWGAPVAVAESEPAAESNPSALVDYSLQMTTPPFVFMSGTDGIKFSGNFNLGASVSPASGALGNKETATLTAYTVTPEAGSTVTQIVEKVNGVTVNTFNNPASLSRTLTVPQATWDTLAYFANHTASVAVTDSNGATTVTTYNFVRMLATGASLLEATKANADAKNRISQKRDALAAQVGLSAGSTFDAISAQLASGNVFSKKQEGTAVGPNAPFITGLSFKPKLVVWRDTGGNATGFWVEDFPYVFVYISPISGYTSMTAQAYLNDPSVVINTGDGNFYINSANVQNKNRNITWKAFG